MFQCIGIRTEQHIVSEMNIPVAAVAVEARKSPPVLAAKVMFCVFSVLAGVPGIWRNQRSKSLSAISTANVDLLQVPLAELLPFWLVTCSNDYQG